jgi:hypothetical protein
MANNTQVEWSQFKLESGTNILSTSHTGEHDYSAQNVWSEIYNMKNDGLAEYIHSHPGSYEERDRLVQASGRYYGLYDKRNFGDRAFLGQTRELMGSNIKFGIYVPALLKYYYFNK